MSVAFSAKGTLAFNGGAVTPFNDTSLTVGASDNGLTVAVVCDTSVAGTITCTWDATVTAQAMTLLASATIGTAVVKVYGLRAPTTGAGKTLRFAWNGGGSSQVKMQGVSWTGVLQTSDALAFPTASRTTTTGTSSTPTDAIASATGDACFAVSANGGSFGYAGANQTETMNDGAGTYNCAAQRAAGASSVTLSWSNGGSDSWCWAGVDIAASGGGGTAVTYDGAAPTEFLAQRKADGAAPLEYLAQWIATGAAPLEYLAQSLFSGGYTLEFLAGLRADGSAPLEALAGFLGDGKAPLEWLSAVQTLTADGSFPIEWLAGRTLDGAAPSEWLGGVRVDGAIPVEALVNFVVTSAFPLEFLAGYRDAGSFPIEILAGLTVNGVVPIEFAGSAIAAITDWLVTQSHRRR
jgi:hypothetical protein